MGKTVGSFFGAVVGQAVGFAVNGQLGQIIGAAVGGALGGVIGGAIYTPQAPRPDQARTAIKTERPPRVSSYGRSKMHGAWEIFQ